MLHTRMITPPFLLLALSPFVIFDSDYPLILCPPCKSKTLWNIFMILGRNVKQDQTTCHIQELASLGGSVGCAIRLETRSRGFNPCRGRQHSFVEIDHEIFSTVILSLPLIQEGQLSVSGERMCIIWLTA